MVNKKNVRVKTIGISLNPRLLDLIDKQRGLVPRSNFITYILQNSQLVCKTPQHQGLETLGAKGGELSDHVKEAPSQ